jgi:Chaperone of endosialidase
MFLSVQRPEKLSISMSALKTKFRCKGHGSINANAQGADMRLSTGWVISIGAVLAALAAHATQPPDPTASDVYYNTAAGSYALNNESNGTLNAALGYEALYRNTSGSLNTALGGSALFNNTTGTNNVAAGSYALHLNGDGTYNTAAGTYAMYYNSSGFQNTAIGASALEANTTGYRNTALGESTLTANTTAYGNTAIGDRALQSSSSGNSNTAVGQAAMNYSTSGGNNTALGAFTLGDNFTGSNNIAIGYNAGSANEGAASNNIDIGSQGAYNDSGFIRIGTPGTQSTTFIAGIGTSQVTGAAVFVNSSGQLGVLASSSRYKTAIAAMGTRTGKLDQLRPVTFHLKNDPQGALQFGLIAEEVDRVYPELVIRDESGAIQGVRYDELAPMLLNEIQQQRAAIDSQADRLEKLSRQVTELDGLRQELRAALLLIRSDGAVVAQR